MLWANLIPYAFFNKTFSWARICKRLCSPGINSEESIPPAYVAWRAGTKNWVVVPARQAGNRFLGSTNGLQIRALYSTLLIILTTVSITRTLYCLNVEGFTSVSPDQVSYFLSF